jgi:hypothetical protein
MVIKKKVRPVSDAGNASRMTANGPFLDFWSVIYLTILDAMNARVLWNLLDSRARRPFRRSVAAAAFAGPS